MPIRNSLAATNREITNVATALAEQTAWTFQGIDLLLRDTARWYQNDSNKIAPERLDEVLANRTAGVRQIRLITIIGRARHPEAPLTRIRAASSRRVGPFLLHRAARRHGGGPVHERTAHHPLRRARGNHPVAAAGGRDRQSSPASWQPSSNLEDLEKFYAAVSLGKGSAVQLLRDNGQLLVRDPSEPGAIGRTFAQLAAALKAPSSATHQSDRRQAGVHCGGERQGHPSFPRGHPREGSGVASVAR